MYLPTSAHMQVDLPALNNNLISFVVVAEITASCTSGGNRVIRSTLDIVSVRAGDVNGRGLSVVIIHVEFDLLAFSQRAEALGVNSRLVHEHIGMAVAGSDESEAFLGIEPLDSTFKEKKWRRGEEHDRKV